MKIGIVTIYNVPNYGAILQAYSLAEYLRREGHEVVLFNVDSPKRHPYIYKLKYETAIIHSLHRYIHQSDFKYGKV